MADTVAITAGSGTSIATDDIGSVHYQRVKLSLGADGTAVDAVAGAGAVGTGVIRATLASDDPAVTSLQLLDNAISGSEMQVDVVTITAGETHVGEVSTPFDTVSVTPTISATPAYTSGDAVGGKQTIAAACRVSGGDALLQSLTIIDKANQKQPLTLLFFDSDPSAATITDNAAFVFSTDISKLIGKVNVLAADYETVDSIGIAVLANLGLQLKASGSSSLYVAVVTTGTPDFASTSDLIFRYSFAQG